MKAAAKSEKNRQKVEEAFLRSTHAARQQLAAQRREDKRRLEKDRIMAVSIDYLKIINLNCALIFIVLCQLVF